MDAFAFGRKLSTAEQEERRNKIAPINLKGPIKMQHENLTQFYILENIKGKKMCPGSKVVMCSTKFFEHDVKRAKELGADDFLEKPFSDSELIEKVTSIIG